MLFLFFGEEDLALDLWSNLMEKLLVSIIIIIITSYYIIITKSNDFANI